MSKMTKAELEKELNILSEEIRFHLEAYHKVTKNLSDAVNDKEYLLGMVDRLKAEVERLEDVVFHEREKRADLISDAQALALLQSNILRMKIPRQREHISDRFAVMLPSEVPF